MEARDYLSRIQAGEPRPPSYDSLSEMHAQHLRTVPFENLDIHLGVVIALDLEAILHKVVTRLRGGFCYELNGAFAWLLAELGYQTRLLSAQVARPGGGWGHPFDHMLIRVDLDDRVFVADVGFGESFLRPLELRASRADGFHLRRHGDSWVLFDDKTPKYRFENTSHGLADFASGCAFHQSSPDSTFTQNLITTIARPEGGRVTLTSDKLIVHQGDTRTETVVDGVDAWRELLAEHFGIVLEHDPIRIFSRT